MQRFSLFQEKAKGPENEMAKMEKLLSLVREPSAKNWMTVVASASKKEDKTKISYARVSRNTYDV